MRMKKKWIKISRYGAEEEEKKKKTKERKKEEKMEKKDRGIEKKRGGRRKGNMAMTMRKSEEERAREREKKRRKEQSGNKERKGDLSGERIAHTVRAIDRHFLAVTLDALDAWIDHNVQNGGGNEMGKSSLLSFLSSARSLHTAPT